MARRHDSVIPLSREHHDALTLAFRLQHPAPPGPVTPVTPASTVSERAADTLRLYERSLRAHFHVEETELFPAVLAHHPASAALIDTLRSEHHQMVALCAAIPATTDDEVLGQLLTTFAAVLEPHIRREERAMLAHLTDWLPADALDRLGEGLRARRAKRDEPGRR